MNVYPFGFIPKCKKSGHTGQCQTGLVPRPTLLVRVIWVVGRVWSSTRHPAKWYSVCGAPVGRGWFPTRRGKLVYVEALRP